LRSEGTELENNTNDILNNDERKEEAVEMTKDVNDGEADDNEDAGSTIVAVEEGKFLILIDKIHRQTYQTLTFLTNSNQVRQRKTQWWNKVRFTRGMRLFRVVEIMTK
jgi:hypothetical protein